MLKLTSFDNEVESFVSDRGERRISKVAAKESGTEELKGGRIERDSRLKGGNFD
jgi:hypothetical protein